jgi:signal transduction histidine kinase/Tfp pilus assembly protein PilF
MIFSANRRAAGSKAKIIVLLIVIGFCMFTFGCSTARGIDLISMNKGDLEELILKTPESTLKVDIFNELAYRYSWKGGEKPLDYVNSALRMAENINYTRGIVDSCCISGQIYFLKGEFNKARTWYEKGLELAKHIKYRTGMAMAYTGIGRHFQVRGEFARGLVNFLQSEEICKNSSDKIDKRVLAQTYYGIGVLYYYDPEDYQEARKYFERHLKLGLEIEDNIIITSDYYTIGVMYQNLGKYEKAKQYFADCLTLSEKIGLIYNEANALEGLGDVHFGQENYDEALKKYEKSHELFLETRNKFQVAEIKRRLGKLYDKMGERENKIEYYKKAFEYLHEALNLAKEANIPKTIEGVCEEIIKACGKMGEYKNAYNYYQLLLDTKAFLRRNEMSSRKLIYDLEKKTEKDRITRYFLIIGLIVLFIALVVLLRNFIILGKQKVKIEEQANILAEQTVKLVEALEKEKEISDHKDELMYTVSHQYKTPLSIIDSSTQILKDYLPKLSGKEIAEHFNKILSNLEKMSHLIDQLLMFGKKFTPAYYDPIIVCRDFIEEIKSNEGIKHNIEFKSEGDCGEVKMDKDFMNIMLRNLVLNSIKYSPQGSKIILELLCDEKHAVIKVLDNGIGIPGDYLKMPFERFHRGSNVGAVPGTGLGLSIVKRYTELHGGTISIESKLDVGTTVTIKIPKDS